MATVTVDAGICGFQAVIQASSEDMQHTTVKLTTDCPNLKPLETMPLEFDAFVECFSKLGQSPAAELLASHSPHPGCPVYSGLIKAIEVACGLALPKDAAIQVSRDDDHVGARAASPATQAEPGAQ